MARLVYHLGSKEYLRSLVRSMAQQLRNSDVRDTLGGQECRDVQFIDLIDQFIVDHRRMGISGFLSDPIFGTFQGSPRCSSQPVLHVKALGIPTVGNEFLLRLYLNLDLGLDCVRWQAIDGGLIHVMSFMSLLLPNGMDRCR